MQYILDLSIIVYIMFIAIVVIIVVFISLPKSARNY